MNEWADRICIEAENLRSLTPKERIDHYYLCGVEAVAVPQWFELYVLDLERRVRDGEDLDEIERDWRVRRYVP